MAIGAPENDGNGSNSGHVRLYDWNGTAWVQRGADLDGETSDDLSGSSVSINSIGSTVVIGATGNNGNGADSGHSRVYDWPTTTTLVHTAGVDEIDFNNRDLVQGDRITLTITGGTEIQGVIGTEGLDALLTDMAAQIAGPVRPVYCGLCGGWRADNSPVSPDGSSPAAIAVSLEQFEAVVTTAINPLHHKPLSHCR